MQVVRQGMAMHARTVEENVCQRIERVVHAKSVLIGCAWRNTRGNG